MEDLDNETSFDLFRLLEKIKLELIDRTQVKVIFLEYTEQNKQLVAHFAPSVTKPQQSYANEILSNLYTKYENEILAHLNKEI